jgi:hypothetical protein
MTIPSSRPSIFEAVIGSAEAIPAADGAAGLV